jgi:cytochrome c-type biogenesis protein CcmH
MLWFLFGVMLLTAALVVAWPIYQHQRRFSLAGAAMVVVVIGLSAGLYARIGTPDVDAVDPEASSMEEMIQALDARLQKNPDDPEGWKMLGRSYMQMGNPARAIAAFEQAAALEGSSNGETLVSLGEAVLTDNQASINGRAGELFESGLSLAPTNPRALFFAGLAAASRGDIEVAADRWELLLAQSPPPEIEQLLRERVAQWRGEPVAPAQSAPQSVATPIVTIDVRIGDAAASNINPSSSVFIIARDPAQPSPPLAVTRRTASDLPTSVSMSDADAMIPGRNLSAYENLEIIVRVSASGQPIAQPGDWYGQSIVRPADGQSIEVVVDQQVPET